MKQATAQKYILEDRTSDFGIKAIKLVRQIRQDTVTKPIISQFICSATSVGANYMEANGASSRKDFANKIYVCKKEAQETKHWLKMLLESCPECKEKILQLSDECRQLVLIFQSITNKLNENKFEKMNK
jgi:four helix bundle protein